MEKVHIGRQFKAFQSNDLSSIACCSLFMITWDLKSKHFSRAACAVLLHERCRTEDCVCKEGKQSSENLPCRPFPMSARIGSEASPLGFQQLRRVLHHSKDLVNHCSKGGCQSLLQLFHCFRLEVNRRSVQILQIKLGSRGLLRTNQK